MIILFVHLTEAEDLLNLFRQRGHQTLVQQIDAQIVHERVLPTDAFPYLSIRYGDMLHSFDIYDEGVAEAMYLGMQRTQVK